jgi:hypothetical protein
MNSAGSAVISLNFSGAHVQLTAKVPTENSIRNNTRGGTLHQTELRDGTDSAVIVILLL